MNEMLQRIINFISSKTNKSSRTNIYITGSSYCALMRQNYSKIKDLNELDYKIYSQAGEDGIIDYLLYSLNIKIPNL